MAFPFVMHRAVEVACSVKWIKPAWTKRRVRVTTTDLTVRLAQQDDHDWIIAAHGDVYATEFGFDRRFQDGIAEKMRAFLELPSPFNRIWVGLVGGKRVASIAISDRADNVAFLNFVLVLPQYRGKGAGSAIAVNFA